MRKLCAAMALMLVAGCGAQATQTAVMSTEAAAAYAESIEAVNPTRSAKIANAIKVMTDAQIAVNIAQAQVLCSANPALARCGEVPPLQPGVSVDANRAAAIAALEVARQALNAIMEAQQ